MSNRKLHVYLACLNICPFSPYFQITLSSPPPFLHSIPRPRVNGAKDGNFFLFPFLVGHRLRLCLFNTFSNKLISLYIFFTHSIPGPRIYGAQDGSLHFFFSISGRASSPPLPFQQIIKQPQFSPNSFFLYSIPGPRVHRAQDRGLLRFPLLVGHRHCGCLLLQQLRLHETPGELI